MTTWLPLLHARRHPDRREILSIFVSILLTHISWKIASSRAWYKISHQSISKGNKINHSLSLCEKVLDFMSSILSSSRKYEMHKNSIFPLTDSWSREKISSNPEWYGWFLHTGNSRPIMKRTLLSLQEKDEDSAWSRRYMERLSIHSSSMRNSQNEEP